MENQIVLDSSLLLYSVVIGFFFGIFYECFRFLRLSFPHPTFLVGLEDLIFFLPVSVLFLLFTFAFSDGIIRWFSVFGAGLGFFLYQNTVGKIVFFFADLILSKIKQTLRFFFRLVFKPICFVLKKITNYIFTIHHKTVIIRRKKKLKQTMDRLLIFAERGFES